MAEQSRLSGESTIIEIIEREKEPYQDKIERMGIKMLKMELVQVERISGKVPFCLEDIVATVAKYLNLNYELMFLQSWDFAFDGSNNLDNYILGERIAFLDFDRFSLLNKYHGIGKVQHDFQDIHSFMSVVESELSRNFPVAIHFDCFYCPWDDFYNTYHNEHMCLVVGIDSESNSLMITDPYHRVTDKLVNIEVIPQACEYYCTFQSPESVAQEHNYLELLQDTILNITDKNRRSSPFSDIRLLANFVAEHYDPQKEFENTKDYFSSKLFEKIVNTIVSRGMFYIAMKFIAEREQLPELMALADNFKVMTSNWNTVNSLFIKSYYAQNSFTAAGRISKKILEAADYEEDTANKILEAIRNKSISALSSSDHNYSDNKKNNIISLDLDAYFNNKGFGNEKSLSKANLTGMGEFFLDENTPPDNIISTDNMLFKFPFIQDEKHDNISCLSQFISINPTCCRDILFLGCSEYGNYYVIAEVHYTDGFKEEIKIGLSDLAFAPAYGEKVLWSGKTAHYNDMKLEIQQQNAKLYAISMPLQHGGLMSGIKLPDCPNMHIFAISLNV